MVKPPSASPLSQLYRNLRKPSRSDMANSGYLLAPLFTREQRWLTSQLTCTHPLVLVDVGCGYGALLSAYLEDHDTVALGVDLDCEALRHAGRNGYRVVRADAHALPLPEASMAAAVCTQFLNQTPPEALESLLGELARVVQSDGHLLLTWRNDAAWVHRCAQWLLRSIGSAYAAFPQYRHPWTRLERLLRQAGFEVRRAGVLSLWLGRLLPPHRGRVWGVTCTAVCRRR